MTCHFPHSPCVYDSRKIIMRANRDKVSTKEETRGSKIKQDYGSGMVAWKKTIPFWTKNLLSKVWWHCAALSTGTMESFSIKSPQILKKMSLCMTEARYNFKSPKAYHGHGKESVRKELSHSVYLVTPRTQCLQLIMIVLAIIVMLQLRITNVNDEYVIVNNKMS